MAAPARADDERILAWLRLYQEGRTYTEIARRFGVTRSAVSGAIHRVKRAEPRLLVSEARK